MTASTARRRSAVWYPLAVSAVGALILSATLYGARATATVPRAGGSPGGTGGVSSGVLSLVVADDGGRFGQDVSGLAPGDVVLRDVDLVGGGSLTGADLRLRLDARPLSPLVVDTATTKALRVSVELCEQGRGRGQRSCAGPTRTLLQDVPVSTLRGDVLLGVTRVAPGEVIALRLRLVLPDQSGTTLNGRAVAGSVQGQRALLTWVFTDRAAT